METRNVTQVRIYVLVLNHMSDRYESATIVAVSANYDHLVSWYEEQKAPAPYRDDEGWYRTFEEGSHLHWYNPADSVALNGHDYCGHGIHDEWVELAVWEDIVRTGRYRIIE